MFVKSPGFSHIFIISRICSISLLLQVHITCLLIHLRQVLACPEASPEDTSVVSIRHQPVGSHTLNCWPCYIESQVINISMTANLLMYRNTL